MTTALPIARDRIICRVNVRVAPVECAFGIIQSELARSGVAVGDAGRLAGAA
ncbi:hypothetical protein HZZ13_23115 [Bradyrhizobium sp. CNPSo 4010]|uniref:Uncharacterized protein n=1 Tax=Bradyrhizobium agreste TaxID=2751811 RepID=A0ABS0PTZ2_9BRAD|nr:hypothetical protein [Bradyrhizobium agreste]MBH5400663.1 hypothetical protein [Bradyrhizobium agreste]